MNEPQVPATPEPSGTDGQAHSGAVSASGAASTEAPSQTEATPTPLPSTTTPTTPPPPPSTPSSWPFAATKPVNEAAPTVDPAPTDATPTDPVDSVGSAGVPAAVPQTTPTNLAPQAPAPLTSVPQTPAPATPVGPQSPTFGAPQPPTMNVPPPITGPSTHPLAAQAPVWARPPQQGHPQQQGQPVFSPGHSGGYPGSQPQAPQGIPGAGYPGTPGLPGGSYPAMTGQFPAPAKPVPAWRKPVAVGAMIVALVLGSASVGGVAGYIAADNDTGTTGSTSSPSTLVSDGATIADVAAAVQPSIVVLATDSVSGSGIVLDDKGNILTNNHVVAGVGVGGTVNVKFSDGTTAKATVVGTSPEDDIAVVNVGSHPGLVPITWGDSTGLRVGDTVLALGSPLGLENSVSAGIVSALDRSITVSNEESQFERGSSTTTLNGLIQTDAAINSGNSGGALVNGRGELIGINTAIATDGSSSGSIGVGFAIPSSNAKHVAEAIIAQGG